jgi:DNA-binding beta-propeller fold protein YncE
MRPRRLLATVARLRRALPAPSAVAGCRRSLTATAAVVLGCAVWVSSAHAADRLYWSNSDGVISYANLDGSGAGDLHITGVPVNNPAGIALDPAADRIYWANSPGSKISYAYLDGTGGHDLPITGVPVMVPSGIALDPAAGKVYWANAFGGTISYANVDGSGAGNINTGQATVYLPEGVAVDPGAGRIYWGNALGGANGTDGTTSFANLDGSGGRDLSPAFVTFGQPTGVAVDPATSRLYWANSVGIAAISFANLNSFGGGDLKTVGAPADSPEGVALDSGAGRIYWADNGDPGVNSGGISYANLDGSGGGPFKTGAATVSNPNFVALLETPLAARAPTVTVGSSDAAVSCSPGAWAPDQVASFLYRAPYTFSYRWSLDGVDIPGATASTYAPAVAGEYRCRVTASNAAGSADQTSAPRDLNPPPGTGNQSPGAGGSTPPGGSNRSNGGARRATTARISALRETHSTFAVASASTPLTARTARKQPARGTVFSYGLDQPAAVKIAIQTRFGGRRDGHRCLAPARRLRRHPQCIRAMTLATLTRAAREGSNRVSFTGRISGRALPPGRYQARFVAIDSAAVSPPQTLDFTIVR